ncbi:MAG: hypothetical protein J6X72_05125, partial [Clostridia bacterium]|nr:hypothetical protein [Clostridia bacterium]
GERGSPRRTGGDLFAPFDLPATDEEPEEPEEETEEEPEEETDEPDEEPTDDEEEKRRQEALEAARIAREQDEEERLFGFGPRRDD